MIYDKKEKSFIKANREILASLFNKRIEELKNKMVDEEDEIIRNRQRELAKELRFWLQDISIFKKEKKAKRDDFV